MQNAPTQSLLSAVNGILDEGVQRKNGEIPHVSKRRKHKYNNKVVLNFHIMYEINYFEILLQVLSFFL